MCHCRLYDEGLLFTLHTPDNTVIFGQVQDRDFVLQKISDLLSQVRTTLPSYWILVVLNVMGFSWEKTSRGRVTV